MTIAWLIRSAQRHETLVPIATEAAFEAGWVPAAAALGLEWAPLFRTGFSVEPGDLPAIIDELRALLAWAETPGAALDRSRVARLIAELERLRREPALETRGS